MPLNFTLAFTDGTNDTQDVSGDVARVGTFGPVWFEPALSDGSRLVSPDGSTCPRVFPAYMDNGVLKTERGGTTNIRLWRNDPAWNLPRFQYRVRADLTDAIGLPVPWRVFYFDAPSTDILIYLKEFIPKPGQKFGRGPGAPKLSGGEWNDDGDLVLQNADGSTLNPIAPAPAGTVIAIMNEDGTVSLATP